MDSTPRPCLEPTLPAIITSRRAGGLAAAAAIALTLTACSSATSSSPSSAPASPAAAQGTASPAAASGGTYNLGLITPTGGINPLTTTQYDTMFAVGLASAQLVNATPSGRLVPQLASAWTQAPNKLSWTFTLRPGLKFSNGAALTAKDVVSTIDAIISPTSQSPAASSFAGILKSVTGSGTTVVFHLAEPYSDFPYLLTGANTWILPAGTNAANWINDPVGAGQFILEKYTAGQGITYKKNPYYWDASAVKLAGVNATFYSSDQSELLAFQSGQIDQIDSSPAAEAALGTSDRQERAGFTKFDGLTFNVDKAPFNSVAARQAVAWALDRPAIVKTVYGGEATIGNDVATFPDYSVQPQGLTARSQNLAEVKKLLGNQVISFTITTYTDEQTYAQLIQQELDATGNFKVSLDVQTEAAYYANGSTSPWLAAPVTLTDWADRLPSQLYSLIYVASSGWSASHYSSSSLGTLVNQLEGSSSATQRQSLVNQIATIEWTDVPVIIAAFEESDVYVSNAVQGTFPNGLQFSGGFDFRGITVSS
jgi:peptide/nickel transport system substrate-binding protein